MRTPRILFSTLAFALLAPAMAAASTVDDGMESGTSPERANTYSLSYIVSFPTATFHDFISDTSFRGLGLEFTNRIQDNLFWMLSFRWVYFNQNTTNATHTTGSGATITGNEFKGVDTVPMLLHLKYATQMKNFRPYVALGAGGIYSARLDSIGTFAFNSHGWQFDLAPEVGIRFEPATAKSNGLMLSARYDAGFGSDAAPTISALSFQIGLYTGF